MREIKFMAFHNGKVVSSDEEHSFTFENGTVKLNEVSKCNIYGANGISSLSIDDAQIIEFTGHRDIDGDEIYDGHILKYEKHDEPYTVRWSNADAGFVCENSNNYMLPAVWNEMKIIGNVYEVKK
jgi:hypothetical protein